MVLYEPPMPDKGRLHQFVARLHDSILTLLPVEGKPSDRYRPGPRIDETNLRSGKISAVRAADHDLSRNGRKLIFLGKRGGTA
jgi:hypothetical protein